MAVARDLPAGIVSFLFTDRYLLMLCQVGLLAFLLVMSATGYAIAYGARRTARARLPDPVSLPAPLLAVVILIASRDALYGLTAAIFCNSIGALFAASEAPVDAAGE